MIYDDGAVIRLNRALTGTGWATDYCYTFQPGTLGTVVTSGENHCQAEIVVELGHTIDCALVTIDAGDADVVPPAEWPRS